jgi:hypothetical protein
VPHNTPLVNGVNKMVVEAATLAEARDMASSMFDGDSNAQWQLAAGVTPAAAADFEGWTFRAVIDNGGPTVHDVSYTGIAADALDDMGTAFALAYATATGLTSTYNTTTQVIELSDIGDAIGDHTVTFYAIPPNGFLPGVDTMAASQVDGGIAAAVLSVTLVADAPAIPAVTDMLRSS